MTFTEAVAEIAQAADRTIQFVQVPIDPYLQALRDMNMPDDMIWLVNYLFTTVLDGRNASLSDGVQRALGREPRDFATYAREVASTGVWNPAPVTE